MVSYVVELKPGIDDKGQERLPVDESRLSYHRQCSAEERDIQLSQGAIILNTLP
jgi:hypothetical protein